MSDIDKLVEGLTEIANSDLSDPATLAKANALFDLDWSGR